MYKFSYIYDYIPTTDEQATEAQQADRETVLDFMDGTLSSSLKNELLRKITEITAGNEPTYIIAFIPSWAKDITVERYGTLAAFLSDNLKSDVYLDAISLRQDSDPILQIKEFALNSSRFTGKNVIVIGSIFSQGDTFEAVGDLLMENGAQSVEGLFVAKVSDTIQRK